MTRLIVDSHLDLAWNALSWKRDITRPVAEINRAEAALSDHRIRGHAAVSLPEMRRGGVALCLGTVLARASPPRTVIFSDRLDFPSREAAYGSAQGQLAYYRSLEASGEIRMIRTVPELEAHWKEWESGEPAVGKPIGLILAMEGCDPIVRPDRASDWFEDGLRCAGLAHYGRAAYAVGTGEDGPLSPEGRELLGVFEELGVILDVTHLSDTSFHEALDVFGGAVLASHNNCRALVPGPRQFADEQLTRLIERDAVIGLAFDAVMLHPGWVIGETSREVLDLEVVADHVDHISQLAGSRRHVALGSDLDGGFGREQTPRGLDTIADLQKVADILSRRGYSDDDIDGVFHAHWLRFFRRHLPR